MRERASATGKGIGYFVEPFELFSFKGAFRGRCLAEVHRGGTRSQCFRSGHYLGLCYQHAQPHDLAILQAHRERVVIVEALVLAAFDEDVAELSELGKKLRAVNQQLLVLVGQTAPLRTAAATS